MREHLPNTVPLRWKTCNGEVKGFLEWTHGPRYNDQCAVCQQGVQLIMKAVAWLAGGALIERRQILEQDSNGILQRCKNVFGPDDPKPWFPVSAYRLYRWDANTEKIVIVDFDPTPVNILTWFLERFKYQFESAHVADLYLTDDRDVLASIEHLDF